MLVSRSLPSRSRYRQVSHLLCQYQASFARPWISRALQSSRRLSQTSDSRQLYEKLNLEREKLQKLRAKLNKNPGMVEALQISYQIALQEQTVDVIRRETLTKRLRENYPTPSPYFDIPVISFKDTDPMTVANAERYLNVIESLFHVFKTDIFDPERPLPSEDELIQTANVILDDDLGVSTYKVSQDDYKGILSIFSALLTESIEIQQLQFANPHLQQLYVQFTAALNQNNPLSVLGNNLDKISKEAGVHEKAAIAWFNTFDLLSQVPKVKNFTRIMGMSPGSNNITDVVNDIKKTFNVFSPEEENSNEKISPSKEPGNKKNTKKQTNADKDKNSKDKKYYEFVFDLNRPPVQFFQLGIVVGLVLYLVFRLSRESDHEITFQEFTSQFLRKNLVSKLAVVNNRTAVLELNDQGKAQYPYGGSYYFTIGSIESFERSLQDVQNEFQIDEQLRIPVIYTSEGSTAKLLFNFVPTILFLGAIYYMGKKASIGGMGGPLSFGKSTAKKFNQETDVKIRFKDVAGMQEAKEEVMEFVKFLQNPEKYERLGAKIPRGAILSGPPGTGKTLIAKATAGEAGVPFYSVSGSEFVEMFVGVGASRVRDLFKTARENAPSIVFVDEIDAIGKQRSKGNASGANDERETTLNQLLVEMDGFDSSDHVVVLAGTNRADILDKALMRPGRFDRHIAIDNPELQGRKEIFEVHLKKIKLAENIDKDLSGRLAALTPGFSGADIANVCNEAALIGARYNAEAVTLRHFELAIERVIGGVEKKSKILSPEEQRIVAYHEAGHAVCGWYLRYAHPLLKVSIIPRGQGALGYAQYLPPDKYLLSTKELYDRMIMTLGGRVSEELHFSSVTSGAHDDFKKVTGIAQSMVLRFGMSKRVGMVNYADTKSQDDLTKPFSDETNNIIDEEIKSIVSNCYQQCKTLLTERSKEVKLVAEELLAKEFITREDMIRLLGKRPFPETNDAFDKYLDGKDAFKNEKPPEEKKDDE